MLKKGIIRVDDKNNREEKTMLRLQLQRLLVLTICFLSVSSWADQSLFPLARGLAGDRELPKPYGVGITFYHQQQDYQLRDLRVSLPACMSSVGCNAFQMAGISPEEVGSLNSENRINEINVKMDLWALPFLNVFGMLGYIDGRTEIHMPAAVVGRIGFDKIDIDYSGPVYGGGATLAGGCGNYFITLTSVYTYARPSAADTVIESWVVMPRVGVSFEQGNRLPALNVWIGAMYQDVDEQNEGSITIPFFGAIEYDVRLEQERDWNYLLGMRASLGDNWSAEIEGGFGARKSVSAGTTYRF